MVIIVINSRLIIRSMVNQTEQVGQTQISSIKTDFENYIASAENSLFRVAVGAEQLKDEDDDRAALEKYIISQKKTQLEITNGINFNVYVAGKGWQIIPDFDAPDDYHATERNWYVGAIDDSGNEIDNVITAKCRNNVLTSGKDYVANVPVTFTAKLPTGYTAVKWTVKDVAKVSKKGVITAKSKGTCYIYVIGVNGVQKKVKVAVK